jgi:hypothetical protein
MHVDEVMTASLPFEKVPLDEREAILRALAQRLQTCASVAKNAEDPVWQQLLELSVRLAGCSAEIAADPCRGDNVVEKSLRLLSGFELRRSKRPFPEVAMKPPH